MPCLTPLLMLGYALTIQTAWHQTTDVSAPIIEAQTCETGLGLHAKASADGLYAIGVHYGLTGEWGDWSLTFQPHAGGSYADRDIRELPLRAQFEVGASIIGSYKNARVAVEYWHLSNAGLKSPNVGLDMLVLLTGWEF